MPESGLLNDHDWNEAFPNTPELLSLNSHREFIPSLLRLHRKIQADCT